MAWADTGNGQLYYEIDTPLVPWQAAPETVVFCHGVGTNRDIWSPWLERLQNRFRTVRFDTRGFGQSHAAAQGVAWSFEQLADDIVAIAAAAGASRYHLVGESMGGTACLYLAARGDADIATLTLASTAYQGHLIGRVAKWRPELEGVGIEPWSARMMSDRFTESCLTAAEWEWFESVQLATDPASLLGGGELLMGTDLSDRLPRVTAPTMVISSDGSPYVTPILSADLQSKIAGAELAVMPNTRHGVVFSRARECAQLLVDFIDRRSS